MFKIYCIEIILYLWYNIQNKSSKTKYNIEFLKYDYDDFIEKSLKYDILIELQTKLKIADANYTILTSPTEEIKEDKVLF